MNNVLSPLDWQQIAAARATGCIGRHIVYHEVLDSTNVLGRRLLREGAPHGTVVLADEQTQGRGRLGRRWSAPRYSGLAVSVLLRPTPDLPIPLLSMVAALATADVVRGVVGERCRLKWPNDVLIDTAKTAGILLELEQHDGAWAIVMGIGLNVNAAPPLPHATCLAAATAGPLPREPFAIALLAALEGYLTQAEHQPEVIVATWRKRLDTLGQRVQARTPDRVLHGLAVDADATGALLLRLDDGTIAAVHAGDVTLSAS